MRKLFVAICSALMLVGPICHADAVSNPSAFIQQLLPRIMKIEKMPKGEKKAANVTLLLSDVLNFASSLGAEFQQDGANLQGTTAAVTEAQSTYNTYHTWSNNLPPEVQAKLAMLQSKIAMIQVQLNQLSSNVTNMQTQLLALERALANKSAQIQKEYSNRPIGPVAENVISLGLEMDANFEKLGSLYANYSAKLQAYMTCMQNNTNPGQLPVQLVNLEVQLSMFQPVGTHSFAQMAQLFKGYSQKIRSLYPGLY